MKFELTKKQIDSICLDNRLNLVPIEVIAKNIAHEAQKELVKWLIKPCTEYRTEIRSECPYCWGIILKHFDLEVKG